MCSATGRRWRSIYGDGDTLLGGPRRLLTVAVDRLAALVAHLRDRSAAGEPAFAAHLAYGHDRIDLADVAHLRASAPILAGGGA